MTPEQIETLVEAIVLAASTKPKPYYEGEDTHYPEDWSTNDRITYGMWREAIREELSK